MTKEQKSDVTKIDLIKISDSGPAKLPSWLIFHNFTFIGFPVHQDNIKFISIVINYHKHKTLRDVFLINGIDSLVNGGGPKQSNTAAARTGPNNNCEIKLDKAFDTAEDLWKSIVYLMPKYLSEIMLSDSYRPNSNQAITDWARDLFTVSGVETDGRLAFNLLIANQPCARDLNDFDDIQYKLTKIGIQFSVVKNVQNAKESTDDEDDEDNQFFNPESKLMLNDMAYGSKNRRQIGKRLPIYSTPTVYPNWMTISSTVSTTGSPANEDSTIIDNNRIDLITRLQASLSTPELPAHTQHYTGELVTPHYPASVLSNIYTTPSFAPEPPTDFYLTTTDSNLITPTPTLTFIVSDTARELSSFSGNSIESISPSSSSAILPDASQTIAIPTTLPTDQLPTTTLPSASTPSSTTTIYSFNTTIDDIWRTTSTTTSTTTARAERPAPKKPKIYTGTNNLPDHAPMIKERIPKLRLTSGVFWSYPIPEDTFTDFEKGNTRNLELSFAPIDKYSENIAPADLFIQFDRENQLLTALPTEVSISVF